MRRSRSRLGRRGLLAGLAGCGVASRSGPILGATGLGATGLSEPGQFGAAALRLCWIPNAEFAGEYFADRRGYYREEGFETLRLLSGGPGATPVEIDVVEDRCLLGISSIDQTAAAISEGGGLRVLGTQYQRAAFCIVSRAARPIRTPADMIGRTIGVQATNRIIFATFLAAAGIDAARVRAVPVQFDPTPLLTGDVDGWLGYVTNEPNVLRAHGVEPAVCLFADHGYPLLMQTYVAATDAIRTRRPALRALLRAEIRGWQDSLREPDEGARLAVEIYGRGLGLDLVSARLQSRTQNTLVTGSATTAHGLFAITPEQCQRNVAALRDSGLDVSQASLFDLSVLDEVYGADPVLRRGLPS